MRAPAVGVFFRGNGLVSGNGLVPDLEGVARMLLHDSLEEAVIETRDAFPRLRRYEFVDALAVSQ